MRRPYLCVVITVLLLCGCRPKPVAPATDLFQNFSPESIINGMKVAELQSLSSGVGKSESPGDIVRRRRDYYAIYKITEREGSKFDEAGFIAQLKAEVQKVIGAAGVRLDSSGSGSGNFYLDYSDAGHTGSVEVFGTRAEGNQFKLWSVIRENTLKEAK